MHQNGRIPIRGIRTYWQVTRPEGVSSGTQTHDLPPITCRCGIRWSGESRAELCLMGSELDGIGSLRPRTPPTTAAAVRAQRRPGAGPRSTTGSLLLRAHTRECHISDRPTEWVSQSVSRVCFFFVSGSCLVFFVIVLCLTGDSLQSGSTSCTDERVDYGNKLINSVNHILP